MIGLLGLNHKSAPIEVRERFVFCEEDIKRFVNLLRDKGIPGAIVLSTCNRTEIYYEVEDIWDVKIFCGKYHLLILRKGYPNSKNSGEL